MPSKTSRQVTKHEFRTIVNEVHRLEDEVSLTAKDGEEDSTKETELLETWFYDVSSLTIDHGGDYSYSKNLEITVYTSPDGIILNSKPYKKIHIKTKENLTITIPKEFSYIKIKFQNKDSENSTKFKYILIGVIKYR